MIKFKADGQDGPLLGFGLSENNVRELKKGRPISVDLREMGLPGGRLMIFWGETEAAMAEELREFIGPDTTIHGES